MCKPASMWVVKDRVYWSRNTESHTQIVGEFGLPDNTEQRIYGVAIEVCPENGDLRTPIDQWVFRVDQDMLPDWWEVQKHEKMCREELKNWYAAKVVRDGMVVDKITSGQWYIVGGSVEYIYGTANVGSIYGTARVRYIYGSAVVTGYIPLPKPKEQAVVIDRSVKPFAVYTGDGRSLA